MYQADSFYLGNLQERENAGLLRYPGPIRDISKVDFFSNDYLGFAIDRKDILLTLNEFRDGEIYAGATGSRLVSGNSTQLAALEADCAKFFKSETTLFFPNGYLANLALLSCIATRHDTILYDEQSHVSIKDGVRMSQAQHFAFRHNDLADLESKLRKAKGRAFVVVESIYSMDGDCFPARELTSICQRFDAHLIVDEAHSTGTIGDSGEGIVLDLGLESMVWARIYTFGKALGASGAVLATTDITRQYLINYAHPFIYSTAPLPLQVLLCRYQLKRLSESQSRMVHLQQIISTWNDMADTYGVGVSRNERSPVQYVKIQGNIQAKKAGQFMENSGIQVKAMLAPTVKIGTERLRVSLHSYNTEGDIALFFNQLQQFENNFSNRVCL